ncbi:Wzz/FepE/Etk N-terminal domain-containing protein [Salininema proteolyticum]|uniref:Wzz/FepE/Etk N-terminal domain-containing protein n=1 Tax=Salininema proteolyticum TaxID=1607685 RepID=A0ABV8TY47_9ACTN
MSYTATRTLGDYATMLRRSRGLIAALLLGSLALGVAALSWAEEVYESRTSILVQSTGLETEVLGARGNGQVNLDTEAQLVRSTEIAAAVAERLGHGDTTALREAVDVTVPPNTAVLEIRFRDSTAGGAYDGARAYGEAYLEHRRAQAVSGLKSEIESNEQRMAGLNGEIDDLKDTLAGQDPDTTAHARTEGKIDRLAGQAADLEAENAELESQESSVSPGRTINAASLPASPVSPNAPVTMAAAFAVGTILALIAAFLRHQGARRVLYASDVTQRCGVDVIGSVPSSVRFRTREVFGAYSPGGRIFSQMRNVVMSQLGDGRRVIVAVGVSPGPAASVTVANLGNALARAGDRTVSIAGNPTSPVGLSELAETSPIPGLSDVWSGRAGLPDASFTAPRRPGLSVIGPGAAARATGPTSDAVNRTFKDLAKAGNVVLVDAPPLSCSADAQMFASHADAVVIVVQAGRDTIRETQECVEAIEKVGTRIIGAVLLPPDLGPMMEAPSPGSGTPARKTAAEEEAPEDAPGDDSPTDALDVVEPEPQRSSPRTEAAHTEEDTTRKSSSADWESVHLRQRSSVGQEPAGQS